MYIRDRRLGLPWRVHRLLAVDDAASRQPDDETQNGSAGKRTQWNQSAMSVARTRRPGLPNALKLRATHPAAQGPSHPVVRAHCECQRDARPSQHARDQADGGTRLYHRGYARRVAGGGDQPRRRAPCTAAKILSAGPSRGRTASAGPLTRWSAWWRMSITQICTNPTSRSPFSRSSALRHTCPSSTGGRPGKRTASGLEGARAIAHPNLITV